MPLLFVCDLLSCLVYYGLQCKTKITNLILFVIRQVTTIVLVWHVVIVRLHWTLLLAWHAVVVRLHWHLCIHATPSLLSIICIIHNLLPCLVHYHYQFCCYCYLLLSYVWFLLMLSLLMLLLSSFVVVIFGFFWHFGDAFVVAHDDTLMLVLIDVTYWWLVSSVSSFRHR